MPRIPIKSEGSPFDQYSIQVKTPEEGKSYDDLKLQSVEFSAEKLHLVDVHNLELVVAEMNEVPRLLFRFRHIMDLQSKVLQQLEDEYSRWYATRWMEIDSQTEPKFDKSGQVVGSKKIERTEGAKEKCIMTQFHDEYMQYQTKLREERYKLALIKSTVAALDNYSYKLHSILTYKQMLEGKNIT